MTFLRPKKHNEKIAISQHCSIAGTRVARFRSRPKGGGGKGLALQHWCGGKGKSEEREREGA